MRAISFGSVAASTLCLAGCFDSSPTAEQTKQAFIDAYGGPANVEVLSLEKTNGVSGTAYNGVKTYDFFYKATVKWLNGVNWQCTNRYTHLNDSRCWSVTPDRIHPPGYIQNVTGDIDFTSSEQGWQRPSGKVY